MKPTIGEILLDFCNAAGVRIQSIKGRKNSVAAVSVRTAAVIVAREFGYSTPQIARELGYADHSSVLSCFRRYYSGELRGRSFERCKGLLDAYVNGTLQAGDKDEIENPSSGCLPRFATSGMMEEYATALGVCGVFDADVIGPQRSVMLTAFRWAWVGYCRERGRSYPEIARSLGKTSWSALIQGMREIESGRGTTADNARALLARFRNELTMPASGRKEAV
jgi:hypothetical protein